MAAPDEISGVSNAALRGLKGPSRLGFSINLKKKRGELFKHGEIRGALERNGMVRKQDLTLKTRVSSNVFLVMGHCRL